jgi:hypothetical protein
MLPPNLVALVRVLHQTEDQVLRELRDETHRRRRSPSPSSPVSLGSAGARRPLSVAPAVSSPGFFFPDRSPKTAGLRFRFTGPVYQ